MSEIPDDIRTTSQHLVDNYSFDEAVLVGAVAAALFVERERCAAILERKAIAMRGSTTGDFMARIFEAEAAEIRNPSPSTGDGQ